MQKGGPLDQVASVTPELVPLYFGEPSHLDKEVRDYVALAGKVAAVPEGDLSLMIPTWRHPGKKLQRAARGSRQGVEMLRTNWENERSVAVRLQLTILLGTLAILLVAGLFVFRPMVKLIIEENHQLIASDRRLKAVFNTVGEAIFSANEKGEIFSVNSEAARLWEYEIKDLMGHSVDYLFPTRLFSGGARAKRRRRSNRHDLCRGRSHFPPGSPLPGGSHF